MWVLRHFIVTQLLRNTFITINENVPLFGSFVSPPYFAHDASCVMLNIDWTPLALDIGCWSCTNYGAARAARCTLVAAYVSRPRGSSRLRRLPVILY